MRGHFHTVKAALTASLVALVAAACLSCASSFTPTEVTGASSGTRLRAWVEEGGGVRLFDGWHDTSLDVDCKFNSATDGQLRCLPLSSRARVLYADRDCATPIFAESWFAESLVTAPRWAITGAAGPAVCGGAVGTVVTEVRALGEAIPTPAPETAVYFRSEFGDRLLCSPARAPSPTARYYALGAIEAPEIFVAATLANEPRPGAIDRAVIVAEDGAREAAGLVIRASGAFCGGRTIRDQERCVPFPIVEYVGWFADDACTVPAGIAYGWSADECGPPRIFVANDFTSGCRTTRAYAVGEPLSSTFFPSVGACVEGGVGSGSFGSGPELMGSALDAVAPLLTRVSIGTGALRADEWVDADGALLTPTYDRWHMADGTACTPQDHAGSGVCGPAESAYYFADAVCTVGLLSPLQLCADPAPTVAQVPSEGVFREVGGAYTGTDLYVSFDGETCRASSGSRSGFRTLGPVTTRTFPAMSRHLE